MQTKFYFVLAIFCLSFSIIVSAGESIRHPQGIIESVFLENKGQIADQNGNPRPDVKYIFNGNGFKLYLRQNGFSYEWYTAAPLPGTMNEAGQIASSFDDEPADVPFQYLSNRVDINFQHAANEPFIEADRQQSFYVNYFTNTTGLQGVTQIHGYEKVTYANLYPGIDLVFSLQKNTNGTVLPKYEFICHAGSRPSDVSLLYEGLQNMKVTKEGALNISCDLGFMSESRPVLIDENGNKLKPVSFHINGNEISFSNEKKKLDETEIIDPTLEWGTYIGGVDKDVPDEMVVDKFQNVIITGRTQSTSGIATSGAYKTTYTSGDDIPLLKFDNNGNIVWGTYYGGKGNDVSFAVTVDTLHGNIFIGGRTSSPGGIATNGAVDGTFSNGLFDVVLAMFSPQGFLKWGTYMGGPLKDEVQGLTTDQYGNVIVSGYTESLVNIATAGAFKTVGDTAGEIFLMKFDSVGHQLYGTYYGGTGRDRGHGVAVDRQGFVYQDGATNSKKNFATSGAFQTKLAGGLDAFIIKWDPKGFPVWCTYFGGEADERSRDIRLDDAYNIYFIGQSESQNNIATSGAYKTHLTSGAVERDGFLAKFDSAGHRLWGTYYGGNDIDWPRALVVNPTGAPIYTGGYTKSDSGFATPGAYNVKLGGNNDAFFDIFNYDGSQLLYQTYYGGEQSESLNSGGWYGPTIDVDSSGDIFVNGPTESNDSIATAGSFKDTLSHSADAGKQFDIFLVKFGNVCVDAFEPNDNLSHVPQLLFDPVKNKVRISATLGYGGDQDYYRFDLNQAADSLTVLVTNLTVNADLYLLNSSGNNIDSSKHKKLENEMIVKKTLAAGTYYVLVKAHTSTDNDPNNCYSLEIVQSNGVTARSTNAVGIDNFSIYPNPAHDQATIDVTWNKPEQYIADLCDLSGKVLFSVVRNGAANDEFDLPLKQLEKGTYLVRMHNASMQMIKPLVVE